MGRFYVQLLLLLVFLLQGIQGQVISPSSVVVAAYDDVLLECTTTTIADFAFSWNHITSSGPTQIFLAGFKVPATGYDNFYLDEDVEAKRSILNISNILLQDNGSYECVVTGEGRVQASVNVEVGSTPPEVPIDLSSNEDYTEYQATCDAIGSSPEETITWILNGVTQIAPQADIVETDPGESDDPLLDKRSVFKFPVTIENYNVSLECIIGGHQVSDLNRQESRLVDIHNSPETGDISVEVRSNNDGTSLTVSCIVVNEAVPPMDRFYIYSNGTLLDKSSLSDKTAPDEAPDQDTEYSCVGANYLGNTTATKIFEPGRTTTPSPPTEPITTEGSATDPPAPAETTSPETNDSGGLTGTEGLGVEAIIGIVIAVIVFIGLVIGGAVIYKKKKGGFGGSGSNNAGSGKKHSTSAVGSSNGNEKEKIKPEAAPRGHSSIQHTNDNPDHAEYAMVDRTKPSGRGGGGDMPDTRGNGAGQNDQGMHYADLDLSVNAGHSERQVPQDKENVVVYSSILV